MYERDGSPRPSWFDPLGFAGLDRVPPPPREIDALETEQARIDERQSELEQEELLIHQSITRRVLCFRAFWKMNIL
jgi:hypothetical protein